MTNEDAWRELIEEFTERAVELEIEGVLVVNMQGWEFLQECTTGMDQAIEALNSQLAPNYEVIRTPNGWNLAPCDICGAVPMVRPGGRLVHACGGLTILGDCASWDAFQEDRREHKGDDDGNA